MKTTTDDPMEAATQRSYLAVGRYIVEWNAVEFSFQTLANAVTGFPLQTIEVLMSSPSVPINMAAFDAMVEAKLGPDTKFHPIRNEAINCSKLLKEYSNFRNEIAHGRWIVNMNDPQTIAQPDGSSVTMGCLASTKSIMNSKRLVTAETIDLEFQKVRKLQYRMRDLIWQHQAILSPTAYKTPSPWHGKF